MFDQLKAIESKLGSVDVMRKREERRVQTYKTLLQTLENDLKVAKEALTLCIACLEEQTDLTVHIEALVTAFIRAIFPEDDLEFKFVPKYRANQKDVLAGVAPTIFQRGFPRSQGDGVMNCTSLALLIVFLILTPELAPVMIIDEIGQNIRNQSKIPVLVGVLTKLFDSDDVQFVFVSHHDSDSYPRVQWVDKIHDVARVSVKTRQTLPHS